jgi:hypothetical protein
MSAPDYSTWLTTQHAAQALGVSVKSLQSFAKAGKLQTARYQRPDRIYETRYHPDDVERLRKERNPEAEPFVLPAVEKPTRALIRTAQANGRLDEVDNYIRFLEALKGAVSHGQRDTVRSQDKIFLTMPEAVKLSGLPDAVLRRMIHDFRDCVVGAKRLGAIMTGQGWRIRRKDLEAL